MRLKIIVDVDTKKSALDESEIKEDTKGFVKECLLKGREKGIVLDLKEAECIGIEEAGRENHIEPEKSWKEHFEERFNRME